MNSLGTRLIVLLIGCAALIFGSGMLLDYRISRQEILERVIAESANEVRTVIADLENWLSGVEGATRLLARLIERQVVDQDELRATLRDVVTNNSEIYGATIAFNPGWNGSGHRFAPYYYRRGGEILFADLTSEQADYLNQSWFVQPLQRGGAQWSEPYYDHGGGEVNMTTFSVPIYRLDANRKREPYAVVTADVRIQDLEGVLQQLHQGPNNYSILLSQGGVVMSGPETSSNMRHYSELDKYQQNAERWRDIFTRALAGENLSVNIPCPKGQDECVLRAGRLETTGWPILLVYDQRQLLAPLHAYTLKTVLISLGSLLLMALAVYLVTARLIRPLRALSLAAENIGHGQLDYPLPRARGNDEVARLVSAFKTMSRDLRKYIDELATATARQSRIEGELAAAREIQMSLLPGGGEAVQRVGRCSLWARVEPARTVGGDLYSWYLEGEHIWFAVGDVSDKGVPAALFMSRATSLLNQLAETAETPSDALSNLNDLLCRDNPACMFVTLFLGRFNTQSGLLQYASAGHPAPSLRHGHYVNTLAPLSGPPLGLAPSQQFPPNLLTLEPGNCLAVFTDGVEEAFNKSGEMFGMERFNEALSNVSDLPIVPAGQQLFAVIGTHTGEIAQSDDIAILLLRYWHAASATLLPGEQLVDKTSHWLHSILQDWGVGMDIRNEFELLAEEIVTNIDKYANLSGDQEISLQLVRAGDMLALEARDPGTPFNPLTESKRAQLDADSIHADIGGLGVHLIEKLSDRQTYYRESGYNVLRVEKANPAALSDT